jgi:TDG/mug DNA glycosylase family protein
LGNARIFLAPNPSPANAHFRPEDQVRFYDELSDLLNATEPRPLGGVRREPLPYGMRL